MGCRGLLKLAMLGFFVVQASQLFVGAFGWRNGWPLCSYDMFALRVAPPHSTVSVVLTDDRGARQRVHPGNVLPLEFFRAMALVNRTYLSHADEATRERLARVALSELRRSWPAFDEVWAAARPEPGHNFVGIAFYVERQVLSKTGRGVRLRTEAERLLYSYTERRKQGEST